MNPYLINFGIVNIRWYSIIMLLAIMVAIAIIWREARRKKIPKPFLENIIFYGLLFGIIGARFYYVLFNWHYYRYNLIDIFKLWEGGLAIHGGIIAAALFIIYYAKSHQYKFLKIFDITVVGLIIGQAIGRWGNFFNSEAFGKLTTYQDLSNQYIPKFIIEGMNINGQYYQPAFFYESVWNLLGFIILLFLRKNKNIKMGVLTITYLFWYGLGRFFIEGIRQDSLSFLNIKAAQVISIIMIIFSILAYIYLRNTKQDFYHDNIEENKKKE